MRGEKKPDFPVRNPFEWIFRASLLLLGAVVALNMAVVLLCPVLPWLIGGIALAVITWVTVAVVRWRRSRW
jgi:membrane protein YdbS with pleckstrin-like domain